MRVIDLHIHPLVKEVVGKEEGLSLQEELFELRTAPQPLETLLSQLDEAGVERAALLALDCSPKGALPGNEEVASLVKRYPERFVGFGSLNPRSLRDPAASLRELIDGLGLKGIKLNPAIQGFDPFSENSMSLYRELERLGVPLLVHTGMCWSPKHRIEYCKPLGWDSVARRFPKLRIVLAHAGWPWIWDAVVVALRNENVFLDVSNTFTGSPAEHLNYLLTELIPKRVTERFLYKKLVFGSDYPRIEIPKMVRAVEGLNLRKEVKEAILYHNPLKVLGED